MPHGVAPLNRTSGPHTPPHSEEGFHVGWPATWAKWTQHAEGGGRRTRPGEVCESLPNPLSPAHPRTQQTRTATPVWSILTERRINTRTKRSRPWQRQATLKENIRKTKAGGGSLGVLAWPVGYPNMIPRCPHPTSCHPAYLPWGVHLPGGLL